MADVRPFRALRYDASRFPAGGAGDVLAPPYDVISPAQQQRLYELSPHNIIRIEYPLSDGDPYVTAATTLQGWESDGILRRDEQSAFYLYEQRFSVHGEPKTRRALFARVRVEPWDKGIVLPHEYTLSKPKEDRLKLLRACRTNISPTYGLYRDDAGVVDAALAAAGSVTLLEGQDILEHSHRLSRIDNSATHQAISRFFAGQRLYIADGHHRFETALAYRDEVRASRGTWTGEEPENFVLMALTSIADPGLVILPIHRLVHREPTGDLNALLSEDFDIHTVGAPGPDTLRRLMADVESSGPNAFGLAGPRGAPLRLLRPRGDTPFRRTPADQPEAWRRLDVSVLLSAALERCFGIGVADVAAGDAVTFTEDAREALEATESGEAQYAFLLNATRVEELLDVANAGARMPQKSTYFYPKLGTGLVLNPLDE